MKRIILLLICATIGIAAIAQDKPTTTVVGQDNANAIYRLYPTTNLWTFILLDTISGNTWQVQWSQEPEYRGVSPISNSQVIPDHIFRPTEKAFF